jgi:hypothetical protein
VRLVTESEFDAELDAVARATLDFVAAAIVALAFFAIPILLGVFVTGHGSLGLVVWFVVACLVTAPALKRLITVRGGRPALGATIGYLLAVGVATWVAAAISLYVFLVIVLNRSTCVGNTAQLAGEIGAVLIYTVASGWALSRKSWIALGVMPAAIVTAALWLLLTATYLPVMPGCYND